MNCPKCKKPLKEHYPFWKDPLMECTNKTCTESKYMTRKSKVKHNGTLSVSEK